MRKINNPFIKTKNYNCFACSPDNKNGLNMQFHEDGEELVSFWNPVQTFEGWDNVLHGGIQATLLDEIANWLVLVKVKTSGVTSRLDMKLKKTVFLDKGLITLRASLVEMKKNTAIISTKLYDSNEILCTEANIECFTFPKKIAIEKYGYPGYDSFFI